jgi:hypothetical protein
MMEVSPQTLFEMTGIFDKDRAIQRFNKGAGMFLMALKDLGGQVDEGPGLGNRWAGALKLPPKGFVLLLNVMRRIGWLDRTMKADREFCLILTPKGHLQADVYKLQFDAALAEDLAEDGA